jgi:hypothetical protein
LAHPAKNQLLRGALEARSHVGERSADDRVQAATIPGGVFDQRVEGADGDLRAVDVLCAGAFFADGDQKPAKRLRPRHQVDRRQGISLSQRAHEAMG